MRLLVLLSAFALTFGATAATGDADARDAFLAALKTFRTDGPRGWSFTQTTEGGGERRVERFDVAKPEFFRWTLLELDGRAPTADEARDYREKLTRRSSANNAPHLTNQFDLSTLERVAATAERTTWRCRLKATEAGDDTAEHLVATLVFHSPTHTVESLEIASAAPFSPTFGVNIAEMKTTLTYSLPANDRPSFLVKSTTRLRGRAFLLKSLDADLVVTFTDHERPAPR